MTYFDAVLCKVSNGATRLFRAPLTSRLKKGDTVKVETVHGEMKAVVSAVLHCCSEGDSGLEMAIAATNAHMPLERVLGVYSYEEFTYLEDLNNE